VYDRFEKYELLFLMYRTYPEYTEVSSIYEDLIINEAKRIELADSLFSKGLVTKERCTELKKLEQ